MRNTGKRSIVLITGLCLLLIAAIAYAKPGGPEREQQITLRAWGAGRGHDRIASEQLDLFRTKFPHINPVHPGGLFFGGNEYNIMFEVLPLMQIAGGVQPDVLHMWM